jgi:hypothetical protein
MSPVETKAQKVVVQFEGRENHAHMMAIALQFRAHPFRVADDARYGRWRNQAPLGNDRYR